MATVALSVALLAGAAAAQSSTVGFAPTPLVDLVYPRPSDAPYQVFDFNGHDIYTANQDSLCQTIVQNSIMDFCLWALPRSPRLPMPRGMQILFDGDAYMMTGNIDQTKLNMVDGDFGGELDSGGQDGRGNPMAVSSYQTRHWTEFIGSNQFCFKWCADNGTNPDGKCQHTLDRIGLSFNCPSKYTMGGGTPDGLFEVCDSGSFPIPGVYTDSAGATHAASSNCQTFTSAALFTDAVSASSGGSSGVSGTSTGTATGSKSTGTAKPTSSTNGTSSANNSAQLP
ncbi:uncharacterized protein BXZ73DRAFT_92896 [Epithele typhae]|uniref:uncharacterized protein n=1 Tax=Epithele typhae TaxID=378194 RepID=UPI002007958E|nr:uncharacterized protein BXZ73DRAFT_92896 [Epithele typhae]KAH9913995.1 hypothetical protein BXZ73DRAFT_92896 [Epithele typhae]